jgi:ABC-type branched-subunit amino acid transport system substrate-binding protein
MSRPIPVPPSPLRRWRLWAIVVVGLLITGIGVYVAVDWFGRCDGEDSVVRGDTGECVGVTAGGTDFERPELSAAVERVRVENEEVEKDPDHVSVALFLPMTPVGDGVAPITWVRHHIEGAYLAQREHNRTGRPKVRLLLANPGGRMDDWREVVDELVRRKEPAPDHLVAVFGFGLSKVQTKDAMMALADAGLPMVGSTVTADELASVPSLLRPAPSDSRQAEAAATFARAKGYRTAVVVRDTRDDDLYSATWETSFRKAFTSKKHKVQDLALTFDSSLDGVDNAFESMLPNICAVEADVLLFAGRGTHLVRLLRKLELRTCVLKQINVVTGDDLASVGALPEDRQLVLPNITVYRTDLAHTQAWVADAARPADKRLFNSARVAKFLPGGSGQCFQCLFPDSALDDGGAIMSHDALLTVTTVLARVSGNVGGQVTASALKQGFNNINGPNAIPGASGTLAYDSDGTALNKMVIIMRLKQNGTAEYQQVVLD